MAQPNSDLEEEFLAVQSYIKELIQEGYDMNADVVIPNAIPCWEDAGDEQYGISLNAKGMAELLQVFQEKVATGECHYSCKFMANLVSNGHYASGLAFFIGSLIKIHKAQAAQELENAVVQWVAEQVGFTGVSVQGYFVSGTSTGTMVAVDLARNRFISQGRDLNKAVVYMDESTHFCFMKALHATGLLNIVTIRIIQNDEQEGMDLDDLKENLEYDKLNGLEPFLLVCTLGTVGQVAIDPVSSISKLTKEYGVWCHVDGAFGGYFLMCSHVKKHVGGLQDIDSLSLDAHKCLSQPSGVGLLLTRSTCTAIESTYTSQKHIFAGTAGTLRAFSIWFTVRLLGTNELRSSLEEKLLLGRYLYYRLKELDGVVVRKRPLLPVVIFRLQGKDIQDSNAKTTALKNFLRKSKFLVGKFSIEDFLWVKVCVVSFRCHLSVIDKIVEVIHTYTSTLEPSTIIQSNKIYDSRHSSLTCQLRTYEEMLKGSENDCEETIWKVLEWGKLYLNKQHVGNTHQRVSPWKNMEQTSLLSLLEQIIFCLSNTTQVSKVSGNSISMDSVNASAHLIMATRNLFTGLPFENPGMVFREYQMLSWLTQAVGMSTETSTGVLTESVGISNFLALAAAKQYYIEDEAQHPCLENMNKDLINIFTSASTLAAMKVLLDMLGFTKFQLHIYEELTDEFIETHAGHKYLLVMYSSLNTTKSLTPSKLKKLKTSSTLWVHLVLDQLLTHSFSAEADSVSLDAEKSLGLLQPMAATLVRQCSYLQKAMTNVHSHCKPERFTEKLAGYNAAELCLELTKPARSVILWFVLNSLGRSYFNNI